ncbi:NAD-dependent epimerase/dehydratase family protein [Parafilimonas sp.]|uniref:NAD-dependent epimerase/dehydratase family protein n=1 Tax=Parafilimonas sp. TaxID=1969739 RepID=UPI0039E70649
MNVLITGGAGYIGTELVYTLGELPEVENIIVYDNLSRGNYNLFIGHKPTSPKVKFIPGEILDSRKLRSTLKNVDVVLHLAAKVTTPFANTDGHIYEQTNHWGTAELAYALEESNVKQLVFLSSTGVYGNTVTPATEASETQPDNFYSISKLRAERHIKRLEDKIKTIVIRLGNVYGYSKSMRFDAVINRFMFDAHFTNRITINGTGSQHRSFIHINKTTAVLARLLTTDVPAGTYNLSDKTLSILDIVDVMKNVYEDLESFFINQNYTGPNLEVERQSKLLEYISLPESDLEDELKEFRSRFTFYSV